MSTMLAIGINYARKKHYQIAVDAWTKPVRLAEMFTERDLACDEILLLESTSFCPNICGSYKAGKDFKK